MRSDWIERGGRESLIVFYNGWGMDAEPFRFLDPGANDVVVLYDYRDLSIEKCLFDEINAYSQKSLLAWSMGVWAASRTAGTLGDFERTLAVNGTPFPIDDRYGIPPGAFREMRENLSPPALLSFTYRMFPVKTDVDRFLASVPRRPFEERRDELVSLESGALSDLADEAPGLCFRSCIISDRDLIFPTVSQIRYWKRRQIETKRLDSGHFPFYRWNGWERIFE
jgi:biotin synthesis protein BioG